MSAIPWCSGSMARARNMQFRGHVDAKMFLYIFGGTYLALNASRQRRVPRRPISAMLRTSACTSTPRCGSRFVADYFAFERVQLFTFDIIEERVGMKLIGGCIVVYACFYPVALWFLADVPAPDIRSGLQRALAGAVLRWCSSPAG